MVSIRQDFINRYKNVQESIIKAMDKALERAIGNKVIDFEKCEDNYLDVYPLIGAVLQKEVRRVLGENANKDIYRNMKIKATKYRNDYRVWLDYAGRWTQAAEELVSFCGLTEDECRKLQEESGSFNDEMLEFIDIIFGHKDMISKENTIHINIKHHEVGEIFNYRAGMSEMTLKVVKANDECSGCVFENSLYNCTRSNCMEYEREDGESIKYIIVNTNEWRKYNTQDNG